MGYQSQAFWGHVLWAAVAKARHWMCTQIPFRKIPVSGSWAERECKDGAHWPPWFLGRISVCP